MNLSVSDNIDTAFRKAVAERKGFKKGNLSEAVEEAFRLWITSKR